MHLRFTLCWLTAAILTTACAMAQQQYPQSGNYPQPAGQNGQPEQYPQPASQNAQPNQPAQPQLPTLVRRGEQPNGQRGEAPGTRASQARPPHPSP